MRFAYKAINRQSEIVHGSSEARDRLELSSQLQAEQLELIHCHVQRWPARRIGRRALIDFLFQLEQLLTAGIPLLDGLRAVAADLQPLALRHIVHQLARQIEAGHSLSAAMRRHPVAFSPLALTLVRAGEASGQLPEMLARLHEALHWEEGNIQQMQKLLIYPALVFSTIAGASLFLMLYMVPQLKSFIADSGQRLPIETRALFAVSDFLLADGWIALGLLLFATLTGRWLLHASQRARHWVDRAQLHLPCIGPAIVHAALARFTHTCATLYAAGLPVLEAMATCREVVSNRCLQQAIATAEQDIRAGSPLADAFQASPHFPPLLICLLRTGENTGRLDKALFHASHFYKRSLNASIARLQVLIEPVLSAALGLLLGWIMLALIGPVYDSIAQVHS